VTEAWHYARCRSSKLTNYWNVMQYSKVAIHQHFAGKYCLHIAPQTLHPKDSNLQTHHNKNLTLSCNKFELTTKAATGAAAKSAVNIFASGLQTNYFTQNIPTFSKPITHPNLVIRNMSYISNCFDTAREDAVCHTVT
jgi:hypothetical protein